MCIVYTKYKFNTNKIGYPMAKNYSVLGVKIDNEIREDFIDLCKSQGLNASIVVRQFINTYIKQNKQDKYQDKILMTEAEFYEKINRARNQKPVEMSRDELFSLLRD